MLNVQYWMAFTICDCPSNVEANFLTRNIFRIMVLFSTTGELRISETAFPLDGHFFDYKINLIGKFRLFKDCKYGRLDQTTG